MRYKFVVGSVVVTAGLVFLLISGGRQSSARHLTLDMLLTQAANSELRDRRIQLGGCTVVDGSIRWDEYRHRPAFTVTDGERAQKLADACRYTPRGKRSFGSGRGAYFSDFESGSDYMSHTNDNILVIAQLEDIQVLDNLDNILSVEGIDLFTSGAQDIAQSMGLPGQPNHQRVKEFEAKVRDAVHAAGRKMAEDVMASARAANLFLDGARAFLNSR